MGPKYPKKLTYQRLHEVLDYNPETGIFIWKINRRGGRKAGDRCGYHNKILNYIVTSIDGEGFYCHHLAWFYYYHEWPSKQVDHKDLCGTNNAIKNLRLAEMSEQRYNQHVRKDNKLHIKGISIAPSGRFKTGITINKKRINLGTYDTLEEALFVYQNAVKKYIGEFGRTS